MRIAVLIAATIWILNTAESVLRPLATSLLIWLVLSATSATLVRLVPRRWRHRRTTARVVSIFGITAIVALISILMVGAVAEFRSNLPLYQQNVDQLLALVQEYVGSKEQLSLFDLLQQIDVRSLLINLAGSTAAYTSAIFVVFLYVAFIFVESQAFDSKLTAIAGGPEEEARLRRMAIDVKSAIDDVLSVQVLVGLVQAVPTFLVLLLVGVDAAVFWAVLVFFFSFIPTIGSIFGILLPVLMTLLQFLEFWPVVIVLVAVGIVQILGTNVLMPALMSRSLNLSSFVVLVAVFAGGALWGVVGALIAVPVLTVAIIICSKIDSLRWIAVLVSANGDIPDTPLSEEIVELDGKPLERGAPAISEG
ncbi:hypothetical protein DLJ53_19230 [Acuticoccus sediminis]|uniref:AI-2E family transporter n=1 Tax=Acuticoccus sediminis TaxID=2184697 RepID=A0A8B2NU72_9HYPH|nr:AI-2E family transporter [Acuticoccus sediminis]RAH99879.1 hypothetical protein DLJ53_19230 [Acuticoccus sediminis]